MRRFSIFAYVCVFLSLCGCSTVDNRKMASAQGKLNEADHLMNVREFEQAAQKADAALSDLHVLLTKDPGNATFALTKAQALLTIFIAKNTLVFENAEPRPRNFIRLPEPDAYIGFAQYIPAAKEALAIAKAKENDLDDEKRGALWAMYATLERLMVQTAKNALASYENAIDAYQTALAKNKDRSGADIRKTPDTVLRGQIDQLTQGKIEVLLLLDMYAEALRDLEQHIAGKDLAYFDTQFAMIERSMRETQNRMATSQVSAESVRAKRLERISQGFRPRVNEVTDDYTSDETELLRLQSRLALLQNNCLYRLISYRELNKTDETVILSKMLRQHYPDLADTLETLLSSGK